MGLLRRGLQRSCPRHHCLRGAESFHTQRPRGSTWSAIMEPRGSKYPILKDSGSQKLFRVWSLEPESLNIGYLDILGSIGSTAAGGMVVFWDQIPQWLSNWTLWEKVTAKPFNRSTPTPRSHQELLQAYFPQQQSTSKMGLSSPDALEYEVFGSVDLQGLGAT